MARAQAAPVQAAPARAVPPAGPAPAGPYDEMLAGGAPREPFAPLHRALEDLGAAGRAERARLRDSYLDRQGITFSLSGRERPLPLDLVPRVITAAEWVRVEAGVAQRIAALEAFLADVYGDARVLHDRVVPRRLVTSSTHFHRPAHGFDPPNGVRIHVAGVDLVRDEAGEFRVLEDNLRCPSGVSYVIENRRALAHVLPEVFAGYRVRPVAEYPERLLDALRAAAPAGADDPTVVVLTPGVHNSAHFEHAFLARNMGVELVEGRDMYCREGRAWVRTTQGPRVVDVIYRRIDDDYLDPLHFVPDSVLGVPGLLGVARAGHVTVANAVGNGVADDKAVYPYVPALIRYYLGEEPLLANVPTFDLQDPDQLSHVLAHLDALVLKPVHGSGGYGLVIGPQATDAELAVLAGQVVADPRGWIAQPVVRLSTCPTIVEDGRLAGRHVDLRPFAVNDGQRVYVLPGGLTRVALPEGSLVVNSSQGGGSKDTWVLEEAPGDGAGAPPPRALPAAAAAGPAPGPPVGAVPRRDAARPDGHRMRQQEGQQQQGAPPGPGPGADAGAAPC